MSLFKPDIYMHILISTLFFSDMPSQVNYMHSNYWHGSCCMQSMHMRMV